MWCTSFLYPVFFCYAGLPVKQEVLPNDIFTSLDHALFEDEVPYVYDDNGNLVKLILDYDNVETNIDANEVANRVFFFLHKKDNPTDPKSLNVNDEDALRNSNFDPAKPTRFITHGWINSRNSLACTLIRDGM